MAAKTFKLEIVTPEKMLLSQDVESVVVPGVEGSLGILAGHAPLMSELGIGVLTLKDTDGKEIDYAISGGFVQVYSNTVRVLADSAEPGDSIDVERAEASLRRAQDRLKANEAEVDFARAEASLKRALSRLKAAHRYHNGSDQ